MRSPGRAPPVPALAASVLLLVAVAGCGGDGDPDGIHGRGTLGVPSPAFVGVNLLFVDVTVDVHEGGRMLVDTGSPFTLVDPAAFTGLSLTGGPTVDLDIGFGPVTVANVPALTVDVATMDRLNLGGIVGGNLLREFTTTFDYRDGTFQLGAGALPPDVEDPATDIGFLLEGGGRARVNAETVVFPATRIPLTVTVEGVDHPFVLDTGASEVTVRQSLFDSLVADGRARASGFPVTTAAGPTSAQVTRLRTLSVAGQALTDVAAMTLGDTLLDSIAGEVDHPIDGLLGGNFLREFLVTVDYPRGTVQLRRYATRDHVVDEFHRVGISIGASASGARVVTVYEGTDAAQKGITPGDQLLSVDDRPLDPLDEIGAERAIEGTVGAVKLLGFGAAASPDVNGHQIAVRVDDLVPPPPAN